MTPVQIVATAMRGQWDDPVVALEALHAAGWRIVRTESVEASTDDGPEWLARVTEEWAPSREPTNPTEGLTAKQHEVLTAIGTLTQRYGYPPTVRELGEAVGLTSASTVHAHLTSLERKGFIRRDPTKPRALVVEVPS